MGVLKQQKDKSFEHKKFSHSLIEDDGTTFEDDPFIKMRNLKAKILECKFSEPTSANRSMIASKAIFESSAEQKPKKK